MVRFPIGLVALLAVSILIYFGLAHRVLDRMRLSDRGALAVIAGIIAGSFIDIPVSVGRVKATLNVGGGLIPIALAIYVLSRAGTTREWVRAVIATVITGVAVYFVGRLQPADPLQKSFIDPIYLFPIVAGGVAYIAGRSRRSAFIAATLGVLLVDIFHYVWLSTAGLPGFVHIGGGGAFDTIVLAGIIAVLIAEIVGESRERLQGGPATDGRPGELIKNLKAPGEVGKDGSIWPKTPKSEQERGGDNA